jgi:hypothetical protein
MKILIIAFMLANLSANQMRMVIADLSLTKQRVETDGLIFKKDGVFKDYVLIKLGTQEVRIKESDFLRLINEVESLEELQNNKPAKDENRK